MRFAELFRASVLMLTACAAQASAPWDGVWYRNAEKSHHSDHTYRLAQLPNGMWKYDDGGSIYLFRTDGKPYPEPMAWDFTVTVTLKDGIVLDFIEAAYGRETQRLHRKLSGDGNTLTGTDTRVYPDGREVTSDAVDIRVAGERGFEGTWKEAADSAPVVNTQHGSQPDAGVVQPRRPYWVISTSLDGTMSWFIPATGELIRGRADGHPRPITGPQQPASRTFVWKQTSPYRIEFFASDAGHLVSTAIETLSADGRTFTDEIWSPGHENERDLNFYERQ